MNKKLILLTLVVSLPFTVDADQYNEFQLRRLFEPTEAQHISEKKGKIYIYDGLSSNQVDNALTDHFERIDNMMFTRIVQIDTDGNEYVEDDGCD